MCCANYIVGHCIQMCRERPRRRWLTPIDLCPVLTTGSLVYIVVPATPGVLGTVYHLHHMIACLLLNMICMPLI
jgi:ABC-type uncharacterized transport system permease subunit